ncbi:MAG: Ribose import ATP-binding protein RbsA [Cohnella sp.]|nr:Ribose import ATP-binding protein RbsA [Cohnella sp.]
MLQIKGLNKQFGNVKALNNAYLNLRAGEIRGLLGSNGSGKSTMAKVLGGLMFKNAGDISINGETVEIGSPLDSRERGIAVAYQDLSLVPQFTIEDNLTLGREPRTSGWKRIERKQTREEATKWIEKLQINAAPHTLVESLDPSTASLVEVAKALSWNPKILLLDEVTACLHHDQVNRLFEVLRELKEQGLAIIIITHRFDEIFKICDSATILRNGETVTEIDIKDVVETDLVYYMTGKRPEPFSRKSTEEHAKKTEREVVLSVSDLYLRDKVKGVSIDVHQGEILGICGLQGQGQSDFLRAVYGSVAFDKGTITYQGKSVAFRSPKDAIRQGIGFISGDRHAEGIFPDRTIKENIFISKTSLRNLFSSVNTKKQAATTEEVVQRLNVKIGSIDHSASSLSGGNQQKLLFGRNFLFDLKLVLLDDPTKGVDISSRREIHQILRDLTKTGTSVLISSSDHEELLEISDRIVVFYEGRVNAEMTVDEHTEDLLISAMLGVRVNDHQEAGA